MEDFKLTLFDRINAIKDTVQKYGENNFYISFSGGKDSTVLHHLVDMALPENKIPRVYINTGIEYHDVVRFVEKLQKNDERIVIINNTKNIKATLEEHGYPFKSKKHSNCVYYYQKGEMKEWINTYITGFDRDGSTVFFKCPEILK